LPSGTALLFFVRLRAPTPKQNKNKTKQKQNKNKTKQKTEERGDKKNLPINCPALCRALEGLVAARLDSA
jgi:hypothetical protein